MRASGREKTQKDEKGAGWLDVRQHGVSVPNNIGVHSLLGKFLVTPFLCCFHLILLQPEPTADFLGRLIAFGVQQTSIQLISCSSLLTKSGDDCSTIQTDADND